MTHTENVGLGFTPDTGELSRLRSQNTWWTRFERFVRDLHDSLDTTRTSYHIANDGRHLLGCDRLTVVVFRRRRFRIEAVSGEESINQRANVVRLLDRLCNVTLRVGEQLLYPPTTRHLPPPIDESLQAYIDESQTKSLAIVPLLVAESGEIQIHESTDTANRVIGGLVVEQFSAPSLDDATLSRVRALVPHVSSALDNAQSQDRIFLLPLWKRLGRVWALATGRYSSRSATAVIAVALLIALLTLWPASFTLSAKGTLQPGVQQNIFARIDGVVDEVLIDEGQAVAQNQVVMELRNNELNLKIAQVLGEWQKTSDELASIRASRLGNTRRSQSEQEELAAKERVLSKWLSSLEQQHKLLLEQQGDLQVRSPIRGQVITWELRKTLLDRPIKRGDQLMTVADFDEPWVLDLLLPDRRVGHLITARREMGDPLEVSFILGTNPTKTFKGHIQRVATAETLDEEHGHSLLVTVGIDKEQIESLRPGASVSAKIQCGQRSLGYVWLHEVFEFIQSKILFQLGI